MLKWLHHILEPHCPDCKLESDEKRACKSCDSLMHQLEVANFENRKLVDIISDISRPAPAPTVQSYETPKPLNAPISWKVMKQTLEAEDRKAAQILRQKEAESKELRAHDLERGASGGLKVNIDAQSNDIDALEKELGVS